MKAFNLARCMSKMLRDIILFQSQNCGTRKIIQLAKVYFAMHMRQCLTFVATNARTFLPALDYMRTKPHKYSSQCNPNFGSTKNSQ